VLETRRSHAFHVLARIRRPLHSLEAATGEVNHASGGASYQADGTLAKALEEALDSVVASPSHRFGYNASDTVHKALDE